LQIVITQNRDQLRKRVNRFLGSSAHARDEVLDTLRSLASFGRVIVFGGAIRDLAIHGNREFPSDIDVVLDGVDRTTIASFMARRVATQNRFGGYRFSTSNWKFDVWRFEDTWAMREGLVSGQTIDSLLRTTFFNWDAIAYDFNEGRLLFDADYFDVLRSGVIDINLEPNPNPIGLARRALGMYWDETAGLSARLAEYVIRTLDSASTLGIGETIVPESVRQQFVFDFERSGGGVVCRRTQQLSLS
jgi:hypothetical protein